MDSWLIRTEHGWVEPGPPPCACGSERFMVGFHHCMCGAGPLHGGHRTWTCRQCEQKTHVGCADDRPPPGYMGR